MRNMSKFENALWGSLIFVSFESSAAATASSSATAASSTSSITESHIFVFLKKIIKKISHLVFHLRELWEVADFNYDSVSF